MTSLRHRSFWLQQTMGDAPDAEPLRGEARADIAILGGGYVGLWTAIRIKEQSPGADVVVLEQDICGGGASGRNGGFVLSWWPKLSSLARQFGDATAVGIARGSERAIADLGDFCERHAPGADFRRGGWLWTATCPAHLGAWDSVLAVCERAGSDAFVRLSPEEAARRAGSPQHLGGVFDRSAAIVHPARLARGLRRAALAIGVRIHEHTRVRGFDRGRPVVLRTDSTTLSADTLVIATNAWAASLRELRNAVVVVSSDMIATAPIPERLREIGWHRDLSITDSQTMVDYYRITADDRVAFGKGGWTLALGGRIGAKFDQHPGRTTEVTADFHRNYPSLRDVPITHAWSGPIDRPPDGLPLIGRLGGCDNIFYGIGWSGNGVGPSVVGGRILASLALRQKDEWSLHPLVERRVARFPPEPIRFIGGHFVRWAVAAKEGAELRGQKPGAVAKLLSRLAPDGLEDKH